MEYKEYNGTPEELAEYFENDKFEVDLESKSKLSKMFRLYDDRFLLANDDGIFHISDYYYFDSEIVFKAICILLKRHSIVLLDNRNKLMYSNDKKFNIFQKYDCIYMVDEIHKTYIIQYLFLRFLNGSYLEYVNGKTWYTNIKDLKKFLIKNAEINSVSYNYSTKYGITFNIENNLFNIEFCENDAMDILRKSNYDKDYYDFMKTTYDCAIMTMKIFENMPESEKLKFEIKRGI